MRLFLPLKGWHVAFKQDLQEYGSEGLFGQVEQVNSNVIEDPPDEAVLNGRYDVRELLGHPEVRWMKEVWFWTNHDGIEFPEDYAGVLHDQCMGRALLYHDYERVLADLAKVHEPVAWLLEVTRSGPPPARPLARAALEGDRATLPVLADALEEAGHRLAAQLREVANAEKEPIPESWCPDGKGPPLPQPPAPPPAPRKKVTRKPSKKAAAAAKQDEQPTTVSARPTQEVVLIGGFPSGGKSTLAALLAEQGYARLNRDEQGGRVEDLLPQLGQLLSRGRSVVLDNLYATRESRAGAIRQARQANVPVRFVLLDASLEDAQFNACLRMLERCGRVLHPEDHKQAPHKSDPSLYPVAVLYKYRNDFQEPSAEEGFSEVEKVKFVRRYPDEWAHKAVIFDFDGTLRGHEGKEKYPTHPSEVRAFAHRAGKLRGLEAEGYLLLGASNQSGVAKGTVTAADVEACFAETLRQLGVTFTEVRYCPHKVPPISCYCRKPGPGMGVELIVRHRLDPRQCLYVGDAGTDRSFARRCGFGFAEPEEFFGA